MSLINKMLRDLDSRHAVSGQASLPSEVRPLPEPAQSFRVSRGIWLLLVLAVLGGAALQTSRYWLPLLPPGPWLQTVQTVQTVPRPTAAVKPPQPASPKPPSLAPAIVPPAHPAAAPAAAPAPPVQAAAPTPVAASPAPVLATAAPPADRRLQAPGQGLPSLSETLPPPEELMTSAPVKAAIKQPAPAKAAPQAQRAEQADARVLIDKTRSPEDRAAADYLQGVAAYKQGRMAEAAAQFRLALQADPRHLAARQTLIAMLAGQKQWADAEALLREGLQLMPGQTAWAMALARIEVERGDLAAAWGTLQRHMAGARNDADYQGFAGVLLERLHKPHEAASYYRAALHLKPGEGRWWLGLGLALAADGRDAEAQDAFRHAEASAGLTPEMKAFVEKKLH